MAFTFAQFRRLSAKHQAVIRAALAARGCTGPAIDDNLLEDELGIMAPCDGCVAEEYIGDDASQAIIEKFYLLYATARDLAMQGVRRTEESWAVVVQPSYEDRTAVVIHHGGHVLLAEEHKAWRVQFKTLAKLAEMILEIADSIVKRWGKLHPARP